MSGEGIVGWLKTVSGDWWDLVRRDRMTDDKGHGRGVSAESTLFWSRVLRDSDTEGDTGGETAKGPPIGELGLRHERDQVLDGAPP